MFSVMLKALLEIHQRLTCIRASKESYAGDAEALQFHLIQDQELGYRALMNGGVPLTDQIGINETETWIYRAYSIVILDIIALLGLIKRKVVRLEVDIAVTDLCNLVNRTVEPF